MSIFSSFRFLLPINALLILLSSPSTSFEGIKYINNYDYLEENQFNNDTPQVKKFKNLNDTEPEEIIISYLAAVSTVPIHMAENMLKLISSSKISSESAPSDPDKYSSIQNHADMSNCFRVDFQGSFISGALTVAVEEINSNPDILPNHKLRYLFKNTCGSEQKSTEYFMEHWKSGAKVFIGPEMNCRTEATMAAAQNLPIISYKCKDQTVSDKIKYNTFARTVPAETEITKAFMALLKAFDWKKFSVIYNDETHNVEMYQAIRNAVDEENSMLNTEEERYAILHSLNLKFSEHKLDAVNPLIEESKELTRIYVTFGSVRLFRQMLTILGDAGYLKDQKYMVIYLDTDYNWLDVYHAMNNHFVRNTMHTQAQSWDDEESTDSKVVSYLQSALAIIPTPVSLDSERFISFWNKANYYLPKFGVQKDPIAHDWSIKVNRFACYLYDAIYLYARALTDLIKDSAEDMARGYDPTKDGKAIVERIIGRKYASMQGFDMRINQNGEAKGNYTLLAMMKVEPKLDKNDYYPLKTALDICAVFTDQDNQRLPTLDFKKKIEWVNGAPPTGRPDCGYHGELCKRTIGLFLPIAIGLTLCALAGVAILSAVTIRNRKFEKELCSIWRIEKEEIQPLDTHHLSTTSLVTDSILHHSMSARNGGKLDCGSYKGTLVALKELHYSRKVRELSREARIEMRVMRQMTNPNINSFIGIILYPSHVVVVREYCSKGSLMDVLYNKDMKLDHLYVASFVDDLIKGLTYLHESEIKAHGNLKSTNCLITSRWSLQVADYGQHELREFKESPDAKTYWENLLWTAPELLRATDLKYAVGKDGTYSDFSKPRGTQKSDVYSFAVILHELLAREGPYQLFTLNPPFCPIGLELLVTNIAYHPEVRPDCSNLECQNYLLELMRVCWLETPELRPDIHGVKQKLKPLLNSIYKRNIMDHMVLMMEKYQNQLEDLVDERTAELREEKKRSENLLQRMLPSSVAQQLLNGKDVVPEAFPSVTIYFSDIVGFTNISGESTPMQVVAFLNKLYTLFDSIIQQYDVYKVETIGDAYMVVSGVPTYISENFHAEQIGMMALHLLSAVRTFKIPHRQNEQLMLRIGLHTGSCVAGVVGKTMPRYCLFGDTVNTASRMESNGEPLKIHCSQNTQTVLSALPGFNLVERGTLSIKGKGDMTTYWLQNREGVEFPEIIDGLTEQSTMRASTNIFPRNSIVNRWSRSSQWGINQHASTKSLATKEPSFLKRLVDRAVRTPMFIEKDSHSHAQTAFFWNNNGGIVSVGNSFKELPSVHEEDSGNGSQSDRKTSNSSKATKRGGAPPFSSSRNCAHFSKNPNYENDIAHRKRSTSLPDGEVLEALVNEHRQSQTSNTVPPIVPYTSPDVGRCSRQRSQMSSCLSIQSSSTTPSQYPSYTDVTGAGVSRKSGMTLTVWPSRKRSLSVGDNTHLGSVESGPGLADTNGPMMSPPRRSQQRKRFKSRERKSLMSLQQSFLRDASPLARLRDASPFRTNRFWYNGERQQRGESLNRLWRRLTSQGHTSEYRDLENSPSSTESTEYLCKQGNCNNNAPTPPLEEGEEPLDPLLPLHSPLMV